MDGAPSTPSSPPPDPRGERQHTEPMPPPEFIFSTQDQTDRAVERAIRRALQDRDADALAEIRDAAAPLRFAGPWLREDDAAAFLGISPRTLANLRRDGTPFDTRERHRRAWYRRSGPAVDGRLSLDGYVEGEGPDAPGPDAPGDE